MNKTKQSQGEIGPSPAMQVQKLKPRQQKQMHLVRKILLPIKMSWMIEL